jgi:diguanylate cyclase (GGDEF)-like protein
MSSIECIFPRLRKSSRDDFAWHLFFRNNRILTILSGFLVIEQLFYAVVISVPGSSLQICYYVSALLVLIFFAFSLYWQLKKPCQLLFVHKNLSVCLVFVGMTVALLRFTFIEFDPVAFRVPTFYIAVLYGCAVLFIIHPAINFVLYLALSSVALFVMPLVHPEIMGGFYVADICSNGIVALMIAVLNYHGFVKHFIASKIIEEKNAALVVKNQEIQRVNQKLKIQSEQDELTQLYNRRKINQLLQLSTQKFIENGEDFSIILLDIDHFKNFNDSYGHSTGDRVLKRISRILHDHIRDSDSCGRWGGEEFIIVCPGLDCHETFPLADRLRQLISRSHDENLSVTASFGVACISKSLSQTQLLHIADSCLYAAKSKGRNQVVSDCDKHQFEMFPFPASEA